MPQCVRSHVREPRLLCDPLPAPRHSAKHLPAAHGGEHGRAVFDYLNVAIVVLDGSYYMTLPPSVPSV